MNLKRLAVGLVASLAVVGVWFGGAGTALAVESTTSTAAAAATKPASELGWFFQWPRGSVQPSQPSLPSAGSSSSSGTPAAGSPNFPSSSGTPAGSAGSASNAKSTGLVLIETETDYGAGEAAGTGMVIDQSGIVVTNHHVVADSTTVDVIVAATGTTYQADVLGYDAAADVAVLQLENASGLATVTTDTAVPTAGQSVTAIGNAEGQGQLVSSTGQVTALSTNVTVASDSGNGTEQLNGVIEMDAALVPGDSGGAVLDSAGDVVAMNVAGSTDARITTSYAIPMATVLDVADSVLAGQASDTVKLGRTAALGIQVSASNSGVLVVGVFSATAADKAGLTAGSVLTSLNGSAVTSTDQLSALLAQHAPGDQVSLAWTDQAGTSHTAEVTLGTGPLA